MKFNFSLAVSMVLALVGFLFFWPLAAAGVMLCALSGFSLPALFLGIVFDLLYGVPLGFVAPLMFPFTTLSLLSVVLRILVKRYMLQGTRLSL